MRMFRFLKTQKGFENLELKPIASECGVRESRTIQGLQTVTVNDYISGRIFDDAICYSFYPIDLHDKTVGLDKRQLQPGCVPTVPLGALIPKGVERFLAAGRIISSDRLANSALRVQATCMATGQAAGAAAALACMRNCAPADIDINELRTTLKQHHAILPPR
ncbi:MAG: FAD-dependent oxidoreductase, partial [Victivallales bacterium]|nr:FAD-dependent oxidoreductase [Victivallales bacterium]